MSKTITEEIENFAEYARRHSVEVDSLDTLYRRWRDHAEREDVVAAVEQGERDAAAGLGRNASDVLSDLRRELGLQE